VTERETESEKDRWNCCNSTALCMVMLCWFMIINSIKWVVPMPCWCPLTSVWLVLRTAQITRAISSVDMSFSVAIFMSRYSLHVSGSTSSTYIHIYIHTHCASKSTFHWHKIHTVVLYRVFYLFIPHSWPNSVFIFSLIIFSKVVVIQITGARLK